MVLVRQLGNGGAFDYRMTNTAFTIFDDSILVDCGYNVFAALMTVTSSNGAILANRIRYVLITHEHDDHIGSLMSFLYWVEFVRRTKLTVFLNSHTYNFLKPLIAQGISYYPEFKQRAFKYVSFEELNSDDKFWHGIPKINNETPVYVESLTAQTHGHFYNTMYLFRLQNQFENEAPMILISGDTKANLYLRNKVEELIRKYNSVIIFHDFSENTSPHNIHCNPTDIVIYDDIINSEYVEFHKVHTGALEENVLIELDY